MPKHTIFSRTVKKEPRPEVHPMWRGIGCILLILIPSLSYLAATVIISSEARLPWIIIPEEIIGRNLQDPLIFVRILYAAVITLIVSFIIALVSFVLERVINPKRKGPFDV